MEIAAVYNLISNSHTAACASFHFQGEELKKELLKDISNVTQRAVYLGSLGNSFHTLVLK